MPDNSGKSLVATSIRWTASEWGQLAHRLCINRGSEAMGMLALHTIKAEDVFLAQDVLPADRHRKLVSIAQGFNAIRARLKAVSRTSPLVNKDALTKGPLLESREGGAPQQTEENLAGSYAGREEVLTKEAVAQAEGMETGPQQQAALEAAITIVSAPVQGADACLRMTESKDLAAAQPSKRTGMLEQQAWASARQVSPGLNMPPDRADASMLVEVVRPFIVMMAEEFAKALVRVSSAKCLMDTVPAAVLQGHSRGAACGEEASCLSADSKKQVHVDSGKTGEHHYSAGERDTEFINVDDGDNWAEEEGDWNNEVDVQPLFDPKLPPSANSDFKPSIGLVGTQGTDFEVLRQRYPQLQLTIVQEDTLSDVRKFGHCQRIIALRDAISPGTDDLLHRLLRHRYVRLDGGIPGVEGQFNAWLAAPGSISAPSRRSVLPNETSENGVRAKKHQKRFPKWIGDTR